MKAKKITAVWSAVAALSFSAQAGAQEKPAKPAPVTAGVAMPSSDRMPMAEFKKLLASGNVVVIDVRPNGAYVGGHIPGALSMPEDTLTSATAEKLKRMGRPIATYCS
jgi:3-mercaptopyruvate sulfurtransferase SseA